MLEAVGISKSYVLGDTTYEVLTDISFQVEKGTYIVIAGESGSGKTTLLHILAGLEQPTSGQILLNKKDLYSLKDSQLSKLRNEKIGMIFQQFYLEDDLTTLENVLFPRYVRGAAKKSDAKKAQELLEEVGLSDKANVQTRYLSGGQKQRVAIARALMNNPDMILADEPTANLDSSTGRDILNLLRTLYKKKNTTIILVTHEEGRNIPADAWFELKKGKLIRE